MIKIAHSIPELKQRWITLKAEDIIDNPWIYVSDLADAFHAYDALKAERDEIEARCKALEDALKRIDRRARGIGDDNARMGVMEIISISRHALNVPMWPDTGEEKNK